MKNTPTLVFDPVRREGEAALTPDDGTFAAVMRRLARGPHAAAIGDRVLLELYGYELVERMRERLRDGDLGVWNAPLWPAQALAAADVAAHAAAELRAMWPADARLVWRMPDAAALRQRLRALFGGPVFDVPRYLAATPAHELAAAPCRQVVGVFLQRGDEMLLEWRDAARSVYAGHWDTPGGKLEAAETPATALRREVHEELGVELLDARPVALVRELDPTSGAPFLHHVFVAAAWRGELHARERQQLRWVGRAALHADDVNPMLRHVAP